MDCRWELEVVGMRGWLQDVSTESESVRSMWL